MKKVWITSLVKNEEQVSKILSTAKQYGLDANGHFWTDDLKHMAWQAPKDSIIESETTVWAIMGSEKELDTESVRFGITLLALAVQAVKGHGFHILWIVTEGNVDPEKLPTPLKDAEVMNQADSTLGAKLVARANTPASKIDTDYRFDVHANPGFGVWVEIGPGKGQEWNGALLGVNGADIDAHGVGEKGTLPQKAVLEYPVKGMKLTLGEKEYTAWAVQNKLDETLSYYIRVQGMPKSLLFGPYAQDEEAEVHVINF